MKGIIKTEVGSGISWNHCLINSQLINKLLKGFSEAYLCSWKRHEIVFLNVDMMNENTFIWATKQSTLYEI